jgi:predicted NAD-dependent protein-ADP-ribosyltransferase YbiA (DUF1768 family)
VAPVAPVGLELATGPIFKFYQKSEKKDDIGLKDTLWRRWLSTYAPFPLKDRTNPSVIYPSMEAALTAAKFQVSNKPEVGPTKFNETGEIHQSYARKRLELGKLTETQNQDLLEEEGDEYRKAARSGEMKKLGAKFNDATWQAVKAQVVEDYVKQRYESDARLRRILDEIKARKGRLMFYTTPATNEFSGRQEGDSIYGENLIGRTLMKMIGMYY